MSLGNAFALFVSLTSSDPRAVAVIDTAISRMGGLTALEQVSRMRIEQMTEWNRTVFDDRIDVPVSSFERDTELRDYTIPAWRYTRRFIGHSSTTQELIDVVPDTAATIQSAPTWLRPLIAGAVSVAPQADVNHSGRSRTRAATASSRVHRLCGRAAPA